MSDAPEHVLRAPAELHRVDPADDGGGALRDLGAGERDIATWKTGVTL